MFLLGMNILTKFNLTVTIKVNRFTSENFVRARVFYNSLWWWKQIQTKYTKMKKLNNNMPYKFCICQVIKNTPWFLFHHYIDPFDAANVIIIRVHSQSNFQLGNLYLRWFKVFTHKDVGNLK